MKKPTEPGLYLAQNGSIKSLQSLDALFSGAGFTPDVEKLAGSVAWVFVALNNRKERLLEIPYTWLQGEQEKPTNELPFRFQYRDLQRIDESLQLYACAYFHKERRGNRVVRLKFLDPTTMMPDESSLTTDGYRYYFRTLDISARRERVPVEDLIVIGIMGIRELDVSTPAAAATKLAAEILYGMNHTVSALYKSNAIPPTLLQVHPSTSVQEAEKLESRFWRLLNPRKSNETDRRVMAVTETKVETLSLSPRDLRQSETETNETHKILAAHGVPYSVVFEDAANMATAAIYQRAFTARMGQRLQLIADIINEDADIANYGVRLIPQPEQHESMAVDHGLMADAFLKYRQGGMRPEAAGYMVGITPADFPADFGAIYEESQPVQMAPVMDDQKTAGYRVELAQFKRWYSGRIGADVGEFDAVHLSHADKILAADDILRRSVEVYP